MMIEKNRFLFALISIILAASVLFTTGCTNSDIDSDKEDEITTVDVAEENSATATEATAENTQTQENNSETENESAVETDKDQEENSAALTQASQTPTEQETTAKADTPDTTEEIVALFNSSANKIKSNAKKVVKNYEKRTVNKDKLVVPAALKSTAEDLLASTMQDDTEPIVYETREDIINEYIVPGQSYVTKLKAEDVAEATCTDNGKQYIIYIKLKNQKNPTAGSGVGSVCDVIEAHEVADKAPFVEAFSTEYYNCEVRATIDKETGDVIHTNYKTPLILYVTVNMFGTHDVSVGFTFEKDYTITY